MSSNPRFSESDVVSVTNTSEFPPVHFRIESASSITQPTQQGVSGRTLPPLKSHGSSRITPMETSSSPSPSPLHQPLHPSHQMSSPTSTSTGTNNITSPTSTTAYTGTHPPSHDHFYKAPPSAAVTIGAPTIPTTHEHHYNHHYDHMHQQHPHAFGNHHTSSSEISQAMHRPSTLDPQTVNIITQTIEDDERNKHNLVKKESNTKKDGEFEQRIPGPMGRHVCIGMDVFDTLLVILWITAIAVIIWYTTRIVAQYNEAAANPATSVSYETRESDQLPTTTICNWNGASWNSETGSYDYMPYNNITFISCSNLTTVTPDNLSPKSCLDAFKFVRYVGISSNQSFSCWQFNADGKEAATKTGYMGGFTAVFTVVEDYITMDSTYRLGIQISFGLEGAFVDADNEYNFIPTMRDSFYALQKQEKKFIDGRVEKSWQATATTTDLPRAIKQLEAPINTLADGSEQELNNITKLYPNITLADAQPPLTELLDGKVITGRIVPVAVTFGYHTLSALIVEEQNSFPLEQFMGAFSGMVGLLMGIDCIKIFRTAFMIPSGIIEKSPRDAFEMIN